MNQDREHDTQRLARLAQDALRVRHIMCTVAESCTGGWIAQVLTSISGSSEWFERGFVVYSNAAKTELLGVPQSVLDTDGAVSEATARAMALGALAHSGAQVAMAVTGVAGPTGGTADKPVGTVCFGWAMEPSQVETETQRLRGDRSEIRWAAVRHAIEGLCDRLGAA
jgi:nicotinamide-nucleotide amidase